MTTLERFKEKYFEIEKNVIAATEESKQEAIRQRFCRLRGALIRDKVGQVFRCLQAISNQYNPDVLSPDYNNKRFIVDILKNLEREAEFEVEKKPVVFLSHSSGNKNFSDPLRDFIVGLGIENNQLIYTSHEDHKIPLGYNIYEYLRRRIHHNSLMLILWSKEYFESPSCVCETGAAWVTGCDYEKLCIPPLTFSDGRFTMIPFDTSKMGVVLNGDKVCEVGMMELGIKIQERFSLAISPDNVLKMTMDFVAKIQYVNQKMQVQ